MNTLERYKLRWQIKAWKLNAFLIPLIITLSITANVVGHRLILIFGVALYSGAFLRILSLLLLNMIRTYSGNNKIIYIIILLAAVCNLIVIGYADFIAYTFDSPSYFVHADAYNQVFSDAWSALFANMVATVVYIVIELVAFNYLYFRLRIPFYMAVIIVTTVILVVASHVAMYIGYVAEYPQHITQLIWYNLIRNTLTIIVLAILLQPLNYWIHNKYFQS